MKKFFFILVWALFSVALYAETATFCWEAHCVNNGNDRGFAMNGCENTGVHPGNLHYRYENNSYYKTKCMTAERNQALSWAQNCAYFYSIYYTGYKNNHPLGHCW